MHRGLADPEIGSDLRQRSITLAGNTHHIVPEFLRIRLRHDLHPPT